VATKKQQRRKYQRAREHARREPGDEPRAEKPTQDGAVVGRNGRTVQPASMQRAARRALLFAVLFFGLITFAPFGGKVSPAEALFQSSMIFVWATVITYFVDNYLYKRALRRG
jgi:hypothetical protein